jgi:hypothetical protein
MRSDTHPKCKENTAVIVLKILGTSAQNLVTWGLYTHETSGLVDVLLFWILKHYA